MRPFFVTVLKGKDLQDDIRKDVRATFAPCQTGDEVVGLSGEEDRSTGLARGLTFSTLGNLIKK